MSEAQPMRLTRDQWAKVESDLHGIWIPVRLKVDGYDITLQLERIGQFENAIHVWIGGEMKGSWLAHDCEERRRFYRPQTRPLMPNTEKLRRQLGRRRASQISKAHRYTWFSPIWKSFRALKRHLIANNESIELVEEQPT